MTASPDQPEAYTAEVRRWLDQRYRTVDADGVYVAHQPIYGFRAGHSEERLVERYVITLRIMEALARLDFRTLLDVGGGEGYKAALARELFGASVRSCDASAEACVRARAIFGVEGEAVDVHRLPYRDGQFDVVLCSETLEHVPEFERAARELLRVARSAVVVTVPREPREIVERNRREGPPGGHIHALDAHSFDVLAGPGARVLMAPLLSTYLKIPFALVEAVPRTLVARYPRSFLRAYNAAVPALRRLFGKSATLQLIRLDRLLARVGGSYSGMLFVLLKDPRALLDTPRVEITPERVVGFAVPLHRP